MMHMRMIMIAIGVYLLYAGMVATYTGLLIVGGVLFVAGLFLRGRND